jgi:protein involved in polysaccharide export with SLBB domain
MKKTGIFYLLAFTATALTGCKTAGPDPNLFAKLHASPPVVITNTLSPDLLQPPTDLFVLGPGDRLDIEMQGNPATRTPVTVGIDGKVYFSLLPGVDIAGLTLAQAQTRLEQEMSRFINQPHISLSLKEVVSKHVWVVGRVNRPGTYPLSGSMTLIEALSLAGGTATSPSIITTQNLADLRHSFVMRQGKLLPVDFVHLLEEGDMSQNIYLKPDDFIFLPSSLSQQVYVMGAVKNPRSVPYTDNLSLVSAMANVNGYIPDAYLTHVAILRGSLNQPHIVIVNYRAILSGAATDVPLEPGDIIYVPLKPYRFLIDYTDLIVTTFVNAWSADMGVRVVEGSGNIGVSVPVSSGAATSGGK